MTGDDYFNKISEMFKKSADGKEEVRSEEEEEKVLSEELGEKSDADSIK